jgi:uncharacterized OsmC-like protein
MATVVRYHHGFSFCADLEAGRVMCDAVSERGKEYPSPPELLMVSLGSCIGAVLITYSQRHGVSYEGLTVGLDWEAAEHPYRMGRINIVAHMPGPLAPELQETLKRVAVQCLIHNTLQHAPQINLDLHVMEPAPPADRPGPDHAEERKP